MSTEQEYTWENAKKIADHALSKYYSKHLSDVEVVVLKGSWEGLTYEQIAEKYSFTVSYLQGDVGPQLWQRLSKALGEDVKKGNFKEALKRSFANKIFLDLENNVLEPPDGPLELDSRFYLNREEVELICFSTIAKTNSLIRIKAPKLMGKTSLLFRIDEQAKIFKYCSVYLDLGSTEVNIFTSLNKFLPWLCVKVGKQLGLENRIKEYWDSEILGNNDNCTIYFEEYILPTIDSPLVLILDNVDKIFSFPQVMEDFFSMLRSWHEKGKLSQMWQQLRLVIAHSTECYIPLNINQSPFNAGIAVRLIEFDETQVFKLAQVYGLDWHREQVRQLMQMVGGHPYLVALAFYEIASKKVDLVRLLQYASTEMGIYHKHLLGHLENLNKVPELANSLKKVVNSTEPVALNSIETYKLHSMGLVKQEKNCVQPRCNLYREYFSRVLSI